MPAKSKTVWWAECDTPGCQERTLDFSDNSTMWRNIRRNGWVEEQGFTQKLRCPKCVRTKATTKE